MITIRSIDHVVLRVVDLDRMARFYEDVLGARLEKHQQELGLYQMRIGDALIDLIPVSGVLGKVGGAAPGKEGRNVDHVCFRVLPWDGDAIVMELQRHGIKAQIVSRYGADGDGPSIYIDDPEGNTIELKGPPWAPAPGRKR
ncbi:MAG: VOC family protein [Sphingomonadaceae bacterium]|nr:VOC family protein [Sphingomonadaceae bacterium]